MDVFPLDSQSIADVWRAHLIAVRGSAKLGRSRFHVAEVELQSGSPLTTADLDAYVQRDRDCLARAHD